MKIEHALSLLIALGAVLSLTGQTYVYRTFVDTRIVNGQSVETNAKGVGKFIISHRFGEVTGGLSEFYGLDQSTIRIGLDYGLTDWMTIGAGRSSLEKTVDGFVKTKLLRQRSGANPMPVSISSFSSMAINTLPYADPTRDNFFSSRITYAHQILLARKFSDDFSLQLMPTLVHRNLVETSAEGNDALALGAAMRYQLSRNWSLSGEYYYNVPGALDDRFRNAAAIGIELDTRGHVFQFQFGNAQGMIEKFFVTETTGDVLDGDIRFGFNISRDFKLKGKKYK